MVPRACATLLVSLLGILPAQARTASLFDRLIEIEMGFTGISRQDDAIIALRSRIAEMETTLRSITMPTMRPETQVEALNQVIFVRLGLQASQDLKDPDNLLPSRVLQNKRGYCLGIAAMLLILTDRLNLPVFAVATPSHVFLRYDDGTTRINIETLQQGANISDEQYVRKQKIPRKSIRRGVFMRNLTSDEFLAQVHNNLGVIRSEWKDLEKAAGEYELALDLDSRLPAAWYNYGNDLLRQGEFQRAIRCFTISLRFYPADVLALNNRGLAYLSLGRREKARRDLEAALGIEPEFAPSRRILESLHAGPDQPGVP